MSNVWVYGPLTRTVKDAALYLDCVAGYHPADPQSVPRPDGLFVNCLNTVPKGLRIAFSPDLGFIRVKKSVLHQVEQAAACFEEIGQHVECWEAKFPDVEKAWYNLMALELYSQLQGEMNKNRDQLGRGLVEFASQGRSLSLEDCIEAQKIRTEFNRRLWELFDQFDLLITPATSTEAYAAEGPPPHEIDGQTVSQLTVAACTYPFNLSGHPAVSVRAGFTEAQLPVGLQIVGPRYREDLVLQMAHAYEQMRLPNAPWPKLG
jgi:aspartyl-tRNA(Asn)/glutamyl-tRNA(Gln) amidotransferase subunit A